MLPSLISDTSRGIGSYILDKISDQFATTKPVEKGTVWDLKIAHQSITNSTQVALPVTSLTRKGQHLYRKAADSIAFDQIIKPQRFSLVVQKTQRGH